MIFHREILLRNQEVGVSNSSFLNPINEDSFLANLCLRYKHDQIYTYVGSMVISINPYKKLPFYSSKIIAAYQHHNMLELPPHIYALTKFAFESMNRKNQDQCVIVTGESGSGKTEASKIALQYLVRGATLNCDIDNFREKVLCINPILEAFGNAKTLINDNSTRFGKFLELKYDFKHDLVGVFITNYLLEKSRVVKQNEGEGNFHIFYQLINGADVYLLKNLKLQRSSTNYDILNQSEFEQMNILENKENFVQTKKAMEIMNFTENEIICIFGIIASVLKLGNVQFIPKTNMDGTEGCSLMNVYEIYDLCHLLMIEMDSLQTSLTQRMIETRNEILITDLSASEAVHSRDALCKALYNRLFTWIVQRINENLGAKKIVKQKSIGILDIYGFENFEKNNYEQFLINYCNEKLHQVFVDMVLKNEQEEYCKELIQWKKIDFFNNSTICDLIEKNHFGIISMLDEECLQMSPVNDEMFFLKLSYNFQDNPYFESCGCKNFAVSTPYSNDLNQSANTNLVVNNTLLNLSFRLRHFTGSVIYSVVGFIEKNNDHLSRSLSMLMYESVNPLLKILFPEGNPKKNTLKRSVTTCSQFKLSISTLLKNIQCKQLNFIKCIKPNQLKEPSLFENSLILHQIRYLLLIESTKLVKAGYFYKNDYISFLKRYKMLSSLTWPNWSKLSIIEAANVLLKNLPVYVPHYAFGKTKIFIKHLQTIIEMEELRNEKLNELVCLIQKVWRGWITRKKFLLLKNSQMIIAHNYRLWKRQCYLLWILRHLPSESPLCKEWPPCPASLCQTNNLLREYYHRWRCFKYRSKFDQVARNRMREKVTASILFKNRKLSYLKSIAHPFRGDYIRLRQNLKWKRISAENGDYYVVYADIINKITQSNGKCVQKLLVLSTLALLVMDRRTLQIKYRIPVNEIFRISLSPFKDDIAVIHIHYMETTKLEGAFIFESEHVIEIVTKLFLVIQNATSKPPEVQIATEFEVNFGKEKVLVLFRCSNNNGNGPAKIVRKSNKMKINL